MLRLIVYSTLFLLLASMAVRSFVNTDMIIQSRISSSGVYPSITVKAWAILLELKHGGLRIEWRTDTQATHTPNDTLLPQTGYYPKPAFMDVVYPKAPKWTFAGFEIAWNSNMQGWHRYNMRSFRIPMALVVLSAIACWLAASAFRRMRRLCDPTLCRNCGYDLRASKDRCPECGTVIQFVDKGSNGAHDDFGAS